MKKSVLISGVCLAIFGSSFITKNVAYGTANSNINFSGNTKVKAINAITKDFLGRGDANKDRNRTRTIFSLSNLAPTGLAVNFGDELTVQYNGKKTNLQLQAGVSDYKEFREKPVKYKISPGTSKIKMLNSGVLFVLNPNDEGSERLAISGATAQLPYFELGKNTDIQFKEQLKKMTAAKDAQIVGERAMITLRYANMKRYLTMDTEKLIKNYDQIVDIESRISGFDPSYSEINRTPKQFQHYIDTYNPSYYMYAHEYHMGFSGTDSKAMEAVLNINHGSRWGIWHESGHQRQMDTWTMSNMREITVNIYSLAVEKVMTGHWQRIDSNYANIRQYMQKPIQYRKYNNLTEAFDKLILFAQLWRTFGDDFYPVLHQLSRQESPKSLNNEQKMQHFIVLVSKVAGLNMSNYFEEWGISVTAETKIALQKYPPLTQPIWLNDNLKNNGLPIKLIETVAIQPQKVAVNLVKYEATPYKNYDLIMKKNNQKIAELKKGVAQNSLLVNKQWQIAQSITSVDKLSIEAIYKDGTKTEIWSNQTETPEIPDKTPPSVPQDVIAPTDFITTNAVKLVWKAATDNVAVKYYNVFRDGVKIGESTTTNYHDQQLKSGKTYSYQISAVDTSGNQSGKSAVVKATTKEETITPPLPEAPVWNDSTTYTGGNLVSYQQGVFKAKWWNKGSNPEESDAWQLVSGRQNWSAKKAYQRAERVSHKGNEYEAQQWTQNQEPGKSNSWKKI